MFLQYSFSDRKVNDLKRSFDIWSHFSMEDHDAQRRLQGSPPTLEVRGTNNIILSNVGRSFSSAIGYIFVWEREKKKIYAYEHIYCCHKHTLISLQGLFLVLCKNQLFNPALLSPRTYVGGCRTASEWSNSSLWKYNSYPELGFSENKISSI